MGEPSVQREYDPGQRRILWVQVGVVLALGVIPDIWNAAIALIWPHAHPALGLGTLSVVDRSVRVAAPVLYLMWQSGSWRDFGITRVRWLDPLLGLLLWILATAGVYALLMGGGFSYGFSAQPAAGSLQRPVNALGWAMVGARSLSNGLAEELVLRAFLISRLQRLRGNATGPVLTVSALAAAYHMYGGPGAVLEALAFNLVLSVQFTATKRFWPAAFAHVFADFLPYVLW